MFRIFKNKEKKVNVKTKKNNDFSMNFNFIKIDGNVKDYLDKTPHDVSVQPTGQFTVKFFTKAHLDQFKEELRIQKQDYTLKRKSTPANMNDIDELRREITDLRNKLKYVKI